MSTPFTRDDLARLQETFDNVVADGATPGGVVVCGTHDGPSKALQSGVIADEYGDAAPTSSTIYDVASLTKMVATWPLAGHALERGLLDLDQPIRDFLPPMTGETPGGDATVRQLLSHTAGLRASTRLDLYRGSSEPLHQLICQEPLESDPGQHRYINRGYILLGLALAHVLNGPLHVHGADLWQGLGMNATMFGPVGRNTNVAPTEQRILGAPRLQGSVHDGNAELLGGVAGHAGVFATARDLATYGKALLTAYREDAPLGRWLRASMVPQAGIEPGLDRGLGWILAAGGQVAYHHGFTGTSLYLCPGAGRFLVIATNAVYYGQARTRIAPLRALALKTISATAAGGTDG